MPRRERPKKYSVPRKPEAELALWERRLEEGLAMGQIQEGTFLYDELTSRIATLKETIEAKKSK